MSGFARNYLNTGDPFVFGFMRQHRTSNHVANRINAFDICAEIFINLDAPSFVELNASFFCTDAFRGWTASDRDKHLVRLEFHLSTTFGCRGSRVAIVDLDRAHLGFEMKSDSLSGKRPLKQIGELQIEADGNTRKKFEHGYFRTEPVPNRT